MHLQLFATLLTGLGPGEREEITDLYWFEEEGVHDWSGGGHYATYRLELVLDGRVIFDNQWPPASGASAGL